MASAIQQLSDLISKSVADLIQITSKNGLQLPELNDKLTPESEAFREDVDAALAARTIAAAAIQLAACVLSPQESIMHTVSGFMKSAALRVSIQCHVAEILRDSGPEGMHVDEIASKTGVDGTKLARLLRSLANRHIFREVKPDFFTNNRISGALDTGKNVDDILRNPGTKHEETSGFLAIAELNLTTSHKASAYLYENMIDPVTAFSEESTQAPFQRALRTEKNLFNWMLEPEQAQELHTFGLAMKGSAALIPKDLLLELYDWSSLPKGATVVDVGGGIGSSCETLIKAHPQRLEDTHPHSKGSPTGYGDYTIVNDPSLVAPDLLATGFNSVNDVVWLLDTAMLLLVGTQERTIAQFERLLNGCGWKIVKVIRKGSSLDSVQAIPV